MSNKVTSLSAQLKRLQVPQTSILSKLGETRRSSFLFDPKEAANMDSESVYCLAMNGLEQLKAIDREAFGSFEATLFAQSSITYERLVQTKEVNVQLDAELRRFLLHLTPYFMLKPAHKCFEWLVYKYKVHVYNVDDVFMCVLPYHDTNYFVRALQLIDFSDEFNNAATWSWLLDNQKRGVRLASTTLATHLFSDLTLFNFVKSCLQANLNEFAPDEAMETENDEDGEEQERMAVSQSISAHKSTCLNFLFSYLSKLLLESIKQLSIVSATTSKKNVNNKQQEAFFALLLPLLFAGLKSDLIQYKQLSHLVLAFLFEKFSFNSKTVNKALFSVCKGVSYFRDVSPSNLDTESIECIKSAIVTMCLLVQSQLDHQIDEVNNNNGLQLMKKNFFDKFIKNLSSPRHIEPILTSTLDELNQSYRIEKFLKCLLTRLLDEAVAYDTNDETKKTNLKIDLDRHEEDERELTSNETNIYFRLLVKLLDLFNLNRCPKLVETLCMHAYRSLVLQLELNKLPNLYVEYHLCEVIFRLESKYPVLFDKCLNLYLDPSNVELSKRGKSYFLNTISFKFSSFKCRHTFKYQQVDTNQELNLIQSLSSPNASIRANAVKFLHTSVSSSSTSKQNFKLDSDFIKSEIDSKLRHESSPTVLAQLVSFGVRLLDYFALNELLVDERLLSLFDSSRSRVDSTTEWNSCRLDAIDLIFNEIYLKNADRKDEFFDAFLRVAAALFSMTDVCPLGLIERLKKTAFYSHLVAESHSANGASETNNVSPIKKFYSKPTTPIKSSSTNGSSSITITSNGHHTKNGNGTTTSSDTDNEASSSETNEQFEQLLQISVKYMMVRGRKTNTITAPQGFEKSRSKLAALQNTPLRLYDLIVYELCVRLCAQSLFFTNADFYFNLAINILINLIGEKSVFNLKIKKPSNKITETSQQHLNTLSNYKQIVEKQTITNLNLLISNFSHLFKSLSIQTSNFVNTSMKGEIEKSLNRLYVYLCDLATSKHASTTHAGTSILNKFVESACFSSVHAPVANSPTKITAVSQPHNYSYFQFSFKFLINYNDEEASQLETIRLYEANLGQLLETNKRTDSWLLSSIVLALAWALTSKTSEVRLSTLGLVKKLYEALCEQTDLDDDNVMWKDFLKRLLKYKEEIEMDGGDYIRTKLNKILSSDEKLSTTVLSQLNRFIALSLKSSSRQLAALSPKVAQFDASSTPDLDIKCQVLIKFKLIVLELFALVNDDTKLKLMESIFSMLIANLNESSALVDDDNHWRVNKSILTRIVDSYLLNEKSYAFFNKNEKYFDYLIGYLNNNCSDKSAELLRYFKQEFMSKLASTSPDAFWSRLLARMQIDLLKCTFDIWLCNSSRALESTLVTSESIQANIDYLDAIRRVLVSSYRLTAQHYVCLLVERANMDAIAVVANETPGTTKEMRKQLKKANGEKRIDWRAIRLVLDLLQSKLVNMENRMETDEVEKDKHDPSDLIDLVPYLFQLLDSLEGKYLAEIQKATNNAAVTEDQQITSTECLLLESLCLNSLMIVYRVNKHLASSTSTSGSASRSRLESAKFNIELLMQILQTKPTSDDEERSGEAEKSESTVDRLIVQQNVLILLSEIASVFPDKVLEHVLIMFVFVGNKLTRKDDSYSFHVINQIIKSILPAIVASCIEEQQHSSKSDESQKSRLTSTVNTMQRHQKQLPYVSSLVCKILQSFVVALPHIPAHRKAIIFQNLMSIIGLNDYLWITLIQALDHYLVQSQDLLEFKTNLEEFTNKQKELLANGAAPTAAATSDEAMSVDVAAAKEKKLRSTLMQCMEAMIALHVQFQPSDVIQSAIYLTTFLNKYLTKLFQSSKKPSPNTKSSIVSKPKPVYSHLACQLDHYNQQQMKYLSYSMLTFVNEILTSPELVTKLADTYESTSTSTTLFETLLERILLLILNLSNAESNTSSEQPSDMTKFQKTLLNKSLDLLERTIQLLDSRQFIDAVKRLLKHDLLQLRRRALGLLNAKLRRYEPSESDVSLLISLVDDLLDSIQLDAQSVDVEINNQTVLFCLKLLCKRIGENNPLAFVKVIKYLSENLLDKTIYWKEANPMKLENANLLSSVLLCCGELCLKLKSNALVYLNQIVRFDLDAIDFVRGKLESAIQLKKTDEEELIDAFEENRAASKKADSSSEQGKFLKKFKTYELLILSCVTCLQKIVQNMANFMSPFLGRLIYVCCSLSYLTAANQQKKAAVAAIVAADDDLMAVESSKPAINNSVSQLDAKLTLLRSTIATQIPLRLLAPILSQQSIALTDSNSDESMNSSSDDTYKMRLKYVEFYMQIARLAVKQSNQEDLLANIKAIRAMFMNLFDLRTNMNARLRTAVTTKGSKKAAKRMDAYLAQELCRYENYVIGAFCEFTFKLSEDLFRPIFFKLFEWASVNNAPSDRLITFYRCTFKLSDKLKNLFVIFASQFVQNAADLLNKLNTSKTDKKFFELSKTHAKEHLLLVNIVDTLSNVFMNDTQRTFVNKERFNVLMEPLVDQIENEEQCDNDEESSAASSAYRTFVSQHLAPCIGNFASCCLNDDALVRKFNYQALLKTKSSSPQVRLATMDVLNVFSKRIGDIYNSYLPETVPFLAELMEDPVEEVEEKVQNLIKDLEDVLGESLQSYFV